MPTSSVPAVACLLLLAGACSLAWAQQGIYTCVDSKGRRLTSDRPIIDCIDREQQELNSSGTVRRRIGPSLTQEERAAEEERERKAAEERVRLADEKKRERALLARYPNQAAHDRERQQSIAAIDEATNAGRKRLADLEAVRGRIMVETEFYKDPAKYPAKLKNQIAENDDLIASQKRFIADQGDEAKRVNARFDEELVILKTLWRQRAQAAAIAASKAPPKKN